MDAVEVFLKSFFAKLGTDCFGILTQAVKNKITNLIRSNVEFVKKLSEVKNIHNVESEDILKECIGIIDIAVATGKTDLNNALLTAIKGVKLNHQDGQINITSTTISSNTITTGGDSGSAGTTIMKYYSQV